MPRFVFRVKAQGRFTEDMKQIRVPCEDGLQNVIINCGTVEKAKKLARKQHDGTFWLLGVLDENDKLHKIIKKKEDQKVNV